MDYNDNIFDFILNIIDYYPRKSGAGMCFRFSGFKERDAKCMSWIVFPPENF